jgi:hypothetical protein
VPKIKEIPKTLHFVWVGGDVPDEHVDNIAAWQHAYPTYRTVLWYDSANMLANTMRKQVKKAGGGRQPLHDVQQSALLGTHDMGRLDVLAQKAVVRGKAQKDDLYYAYKAGNKLLSLLQKLNARGVEGRDVRGNLSKSFSNVSVYNLEMANQSPNLGAASDVLRLEILIKYGGIYMDVDLGFVKHFPDPLQVREDLALFGVYNTRACNALIAACAGSALLKECRASIKETYKQLALDAELARFYDKDMRGFTVERTGPTLVRTAADRAENDERIKGKLSYADAMDWAIANVYFPDGYVEWDTPASKVHKWIAV